MTNGSPRRSAGNGETAHKHATITFRHTIPSEQFPAERDRYVLYFHYGCPWAQRALIVRALKGLDNIIGLVELDGKDPVKGWEFTGVRGPERDPYYGVKYLRDLYLRANPHYNGRITVPVLWDLKNETIVNNESSDIISFLYNAFDEFLPLEDRESNKPDGGFRPPHLIKEIDAFNNWVFDTVNNGVYRIGFATTQQVYDENIWKLFNALDRLEAYLGEPGHSPYLFGERITEPDVRLFTSLVRFDCAYYTIFKCNVKMIRHDYPNLHAWLRRLYWDESDRTKGGAFMKTTNFAVIKAGYSRAFGGQHAIVPAGPLPYILPL
ncbi:hypothetical protein BU16DRAFT_568161 [Lophium mytilinum]|uniref:GST C-terminal domain-containing protein n=1 Tax=Lophium mytilinum TaxID=390894 RepID=A0A6A6Q861_9PEZI|nr:hypothetical protein BU16DRAFT_568161 [Lophium mytilinum]